MVVSCKALINDSHTCFQCKLSIYLVGMLFDQQGISVIEKNLRDPYENFVEIRKKIPVEPWSSC